MTDISKIDISKPRWDQSTYLGRAKYFFTTTNPLNLLATNRQLEEAREIIRKHRAGERLNITENELWKAKNLYDSAFHPVTGEKQILIGRMSAQVPMNMTITGCMMAFYQGTPAVVFWQWVNQSFNAVVNYVNRSDADMTPTQIGLAYLGATTSAVITALTLNKGVKNSPPLVQRLVPFAAVAAANCVNLPIMRNKELREGISIFDENGNVVGKSQTAARNATVQVVLSRIFMASPSMLLTPVIINHLASRKAFVRRPWLEPALTVGLCGFFLSIATPLACAVFIQNVPVKSDNLEEHIQKTVGAGKILYYNKGL